MNVAYISTDFGVPVFGCKGASIHLREMVAALRKARHSVLVVSPAMNVEQAATENRENGKKENHGGDVAFLPVLQQEHHLQLFKELKGLDEFRGRTTRIRQELRDQLYNLTLYKRALFHLRSRRVDFIYERYALFGCAGIRLARELGVPHILEVNAPLAYEQERRCGLEMRELTQEAERRIFSETDQVIVVSRRLQEFVVSCGVPESRIQVLPNGVNPERFTRSGSQNGKAIRARYQLGGKKVIGFVGSLKPWHGTETLIKAFQELHALAPNTHLMLIGDGPGRETLERYTQASRLGQTVTFTGVVPYDDIPAYIGAMDITVAPFVPNENFYYSPIKLFEYMIMGKPVVAGRIGQVEEVITDGETGLLFEPGDIGQLAAALVKLTTDSQLCRRISEKAKAWVLQEERTWDRNAKHVIDLVRRLLGQRSKFSRVTQEKLEAGGNIVKFQSKVGSGS
ncbi:MAG: glycosyltransferase family 4 protein [Candidatus Binatia bacterium]